MAGSPAYRYDGIRSTSDRDVHLRDAERHDATAIRMATDRWRSTRGHAARPVRLARRLSRSIPAAPRRPVPDTSVPTYALYPLISPKGKDRDGRQGCGLAGGYALQSSESRALNPFYFRSASRSIRSVSADARVRCLHRTDTEPQTGTKRLRIIDNITNHQLSTR